MLSGSPLTFFLDLRQKQRVAYGGIVDTGKVTVLSASPELFIEQEGRIVSTRPMKGTAPRAGTIEADAEARRQLATDVKQRAENLMIVDLMRNDIGRIAEIGSVSVTDLFTVETFQTLHQMTSGVRATLKAGHRHGRAAARHLSAGLGHRRAEDPRDGADPRVSRRSRAASTAAPSATSRRRAARCSTWRSARRSCSATPPARWASAPASSGIRKARRNTPSAS